MAGVQQLILGGALVSLKQYQAAVTAYRSCIAQRTALESSADDDFHHVSAYAQYELAMLLLQCSTDVSGGPFDHDNMYIPNKYYSNHLSCTTCIVASTVLMVE